MSGYKEKLLPFKSNQERNWLLVKLCKLHPWRLSRATWINLEKCGLTSWLTLLQAGIDSIKDLLIFWIRLYFCHFTKTLSFHSADIVQEFRLDGCQFICISEIGTLSWRMIKADKLSLYSNLVFVHFWEVTKIKHGSHNLSTPDWGLNKTCVQFHQNVLGGSIMHSVCAFWIFFF